MLVLLVAGGCTTGSDRDSEADIAGAYSHIMEWVAQRSGSDSDRPVVYAVALGEGFSIDLSLQAKILDNVGDEVDVRFVDDRSEAFADGTVRDGGVLMAVGPAVEDNRDIVIEGEETTDDERVIHWRFELRADRNADWSFVRAPSTANE